MATNNNGGRKTSLSVDMYNIYTVKPVLSGHLSDKEKVAF